MLKQKSKIVNLRKEQERLKSLRKYIVNLPAGNILNEKILKRIHDTDQEILELIKTDSEEFEILKEYDKIDTIEREINQKGTAKREQKRLVEKLIAKKNLEAKQQQNYVKELTKKKKAEAKEEAVKEVSSLTDEELNFDNN